LLALLGIGLKWQEEDYKKRKDENTISGSTKKE
jgi:hypothetical protein